MWSLISKGFLPCTPTLPFCLPFGNGERKASRVFSPSAWNICILDICMVLSFASSPLYSNVMSPWAPSDHLIITRMSRHCSSWVVSVELTTTRQSPNGMIRLFPVSPHWSVNPSWLGVCFCLVHSTGTVGTQKLVSLSRNKITQQRGGNQKGL